MYTVRRENKRRKVKIINPCCIAVKNETRTHIHTSWFNFQSGVIEMLDLSLLYEKPPNNERISPELTSADT